jgi:NAD/NADP transhydrogenase beta subunit
MIMELGLYTGIKTVSYLCGALTFIIGLKMMGSPKRARSGNAIAALGMVVSIFATIFFHTNAQGELKPIPVAVYAVLVLHLGWLDYSQKSSDDKNARTRFYV